MKMLRHFAFAAFLVLASAPTYGQWQAPNHAVPLGRGAGVTGFGSVAPGAAGLPLVSNGSGVDPSFQGGLALSGLTINPAVGSVAQPLAILTNSPNPTNVVSNTPELGVGSFTLNAIRSVGDSIGLDNVTAKQVNTLTVINTAGGSQINGARNAFYSFFALTAATAPTNPCKCYVSSTFWAQAYFNDGGTGTSTANSKGTLFATNPVALLGPGATNWREITGAEVNIAIQAGASASYKNAWSLVALNTDAVQGSVYDAALSISSQGGAVGWKNGILFSAANGQAPVASNGTLIGTQDAGAVTNGINFGSYTFSGAAIATPGFLVVGTGDTTVRHLSGATAVPTASACPGFALAPGSSDTAGSVSMTSATSCAMIFGAAYANPPYCVITPWASLSTVQANASTGAVAISFGTAQTKFTYTCMGN